MLKFFYFKYFSRFSELLLRMFSHLAKKILSMHQNTPKKTKQKQKTFKNMKIMFIFNKQNDNK